jgi:hypothetical protein
MNKLIEGMGNGIGLLGIATCTVAGLSRLTGEWYTLGFQSMVLFNVGIGLMVAACLAKLHVLGSR